ncbi:unnamed protein product [Gongylonema pulchrum]|uniref:Uncharacterized protein n=1 Tax=Gongylonema pulchrum TaxID=637853 RepID=A0A183EP18_9BILA|nr:unnamed protein product [Gongylonema pulchrum]
MTTYSVHPGAAAAAAPAAAASRRLAPPHHHHQQQQQHPRHHHHHHPAPSLDPSSRVVAVQRLVNGTTTSSSSVSIPVAVPPYDVAAAVAGVPPPPNPALANGTICRPSSSDCGGSSSGLGGMTRTDIWKITMVDVLETASPGATGEQQQIASFRCFLFKFVYLLLLSRMSSSSSKPIFPFLSAIVVSPPNTTSSTDMSVH